jgi:hypothetical protein
MKKLLLGVLAMSLMTAQDIAGNYRVSALDVQYYDVARQQTDVNVSDHYGLGVVLTLQTINAGDIFYGTHSGPYNEATLAAVGINLNVNFNEDGSATLAEGSYYPDVNEENCVSAVQILPITDNMVYSSDMTAVSPVPATNLLGLPSISARAGELHGGLSLGEALIFDYYPMGAMGYVNQFGPDQAYMTGDEVAPVTLPIGVNGADGELLLPAGAHLPGVHGGWVSVGDAVHAGGSQIGEGSPAPDLFAEWHAIDGTASESGLGDFIGQDEDGFDGDFDRTFGLPVIPSATYFTGAAGCNSAGAWAEDLGSTAVAGDVTEPLRAAVTAGCYDAVRGNVLAGCNASVQAGIVAQCDAAGGVANTVFGGCVAEATGEDFAVGCSAAGVALAVTGACLDAGGPAEAVDGLPSCGQLGDAYAASCADADDPCACAAAAASSTDPASLCSLAASIGASTFADCGELAASYSQEGLDGLALSINGISCTDLPATYSAESLDELALGATGATCPQSGDGWVALCIAAVDVAQQVYVMDPSGASAAYSNFVTMHGVLASQTAEGLAAQGLSVEEGIAAGLFNPAWLTNDSGTEVDVVCLADGDPSDCTGRLLFDFTPTCIPEIEVRQVVIEAVALGVSDACTVAGDASGDGSVNVLDVVQIVAAILGNGTLTEEGALCADFNADGTLNVLDVVSLVSSILGNGRVDSASSVEIIKSNADAKFKANGYVGAIQMTITHDENFSIEMTEKAMVADYYTEGNSTTLMVVDPQSDELFTTDGIYTVESVIAASNGEYIEISVPTSFSVSNAFPNPFNPTTSLNLVLDADANVSVKVFNVMGQLVDVIAQGQMTQGSHAINWNASASPSGVYFINTEVGSSLSSQKVMLLK